ncbi:hypothetical protein ACFYSJ_30840 [Streptomyces sp. NPDC005248]|uniref:LexA family protein n=1 Tax=Streptomyces sp. NPDC005248 TaxID=3364709 RepID=UPI0036A813AC
MSADGLTARQEAVRSGTSSRTPETPPTIREIGQRVGLSNPGSVACQLGRLENLGLAGRSERHWRSCRLAG